MIIVVATLDFADREARDKAVTITAPIQWATRVEEPGCQAYCFAADPSVDTRIQVYELWDDEASLAAHFQHPNYDAMRAALQGQGIVGTANRMFLVARDEPVYGPQGQIRDRFFVDSPGDCRLTEPWPPSSTSTPTWCSRRPSVGRAATAPSSAVDDAGVPSFRVGTYAMKPMGYRGSVFMDVDKRLRLMDRSGIDRQLLSPNPLTFFHGIEAERRHLVLSRPQRRHGRARGPAPGSVPGRHRPADAGRRRLHRRADPGGPGARPRRALRRHRLRLRARRQPARRPLPRPRRARRAAVPPPGVVGR